MSLEGHVFKVTNATEAFAPVVLGDQLPTSGFTPWSNLNVSLVFFAEPFLGIPLPVGVSTAVTAADGSFSLKDLSSGSPLQVDNVALLVNSGVPLYRSGLIPVNEARTKELNVWLFPDTLPENDGISAGSVSSLLGSAGLPGDTLIISNPAGLDFFGSEGQVSLSFGISITPDQSINVSDFFDLGLRWWDINVGWPTSWFESADDVLNSIKSGLSSAGGSVNSAVLSKMKTVIESQEGLSASLTTQFLQRVTVTFMTVQFPHLHAWPIGNTSDGTIVITANPCIGFPSNFGVEPAAG